MTPPRRILELNVPSVDDPAYARQAALLLPCWRGVLERDLEVITLEGAPGFQVRLIGKDGGEKLRSEQPVGMPELFALIDAMPMRQEELRRAKPRE